MHTTGRTVAVPAAVTTGEGDVTHRGPTGAPSGRAGPPDRSVTVPVVVERSSGAVTDPAAAGTAG